MAEPAEVEPVPSSSEPQIVTEEKTEEGPPPEKRRKTDDLDQEKLENRLGGILCCAVCLDLPQAAVYQCTNGHLMCAPCFTHLLADARLRDEAATCPNCRVEISKTSASRNLAVEKTVSELPSECKFCARVFPRHSLQHHEEKKCEERVPMYTFAQTVVCSERPRPAWEGWVRVAASVYLLLLEALRRSYLVSEAPRRPKRRGRRLTCCKFACIGCPWRGPQHEAGAHEDACPRPRLRAADVVGSLQARESDLLQENRVFAHLIDMLNYEKITFNDLQLKPYRTEEFVHKLYYESSRFSAFGHQWVVKAFVNNNQRDPTQSYERELSYQVILKSKAAAVLSVSCVALRGPYGEARVTPRLLEHAFGESAPESPPAALALADPGDTNRLLANKALHFRLIMFLATK